MSDDLVTLRQSELDERIAEALAEMVPDAQIAMALLKRFTESTSYYCWSEEGAATRVPFLSIDGKIDITPEEREALERVTGHKGGDWWDSTPKGSAS